MDAVQAQYEKWVYPQPIPDLTAPEHRQRDLSDPGRYWYTYWPAEAPREDLDILVAGCGANAAARYAFHHPKARVLGVDLSAASLAHEQYLKDKHGLANLTLRQARLEEVASLGQTFDFIESSGVLHHLPDPVAGLRALGSVLRPNGSIAVMVYATYPRARVYQLRDLFQLLGVRQEVSDVALVKRTLTQLPEFRNEDPRTNAKDIAFDAGVVDALLHPQDRAYTVPECIAFVREAGLAFQGWWDNWFVHPEGQLERGTDLYNRVNALPPAAMWEAMELFSGMIGQHTFCACLPSRATESYRVDFASHAFLRYVPVLRSKAVGTAPGAPNQIVVKRGNLPAYVLNDEETALYRQIDGTRTIAECFNAAGLHGDRAAICRAAFQFLWRLSYVFLRLPSVTTAV